MTLLTMDSDEWDEREEEEWECICICRGNTQGAWCLQHAGGVEATWHALIEPRKQHAGGVLSQHAGGVLTWRKLVGPFAAPRGGRVLTWRKLIGPIGAMEDTANLVVYRNGEIIRNTHEGVRFVSQNSFSFVVPCTMTLMELQNGLCQSMENGTLMRVSRILYRNSVVVFGGLIQFDTIPITDEASMQNMFEIHRQTYMRHPQIELYVEFEAEEAVAVQNDIDVNDDIAAVYEGMNSDSEEDFEATYEAGDEDEDGDVGVKAAVENVVVRPSSSQPMGVPPFMYELDLDAMHAPEFPEYANRGIADPEDGEFRIGMEYSSRKSVVAAIRSFTISRGVDYDVFESEPQTFYAKCKMYGRGCDWLIRASLIRRKGCWEIRRYNGRHTCTIGTISQDHSKLDSDTVAEAIRPLVDNFLRAFKVPHLQKLVVNIGYSRTVEEYNTNYKRLEERGEAYARWCDAIGLRHWVLAFDEGHRWGHMTTNLVECINSVLKGARNLPVLALTGRNTPPAWLHWDSATLTALTYHAPGVMSHHAPDVLPAQPPRPRRAATWAIHLSHHAPGVLPPATPAAPPRPRRVEGELHPPVISLLGQYSANSPSLPPYKK
ncbi:hypothetical protein Ahy_A01g003812 [Arachis hypogaea]|uniref:Transposase MuDR plant domain-containing protein n=1 Tax=Arachis hypogaea TaxID=3818 RepID=A0A445EU62_ARAHY|nr:hypothetical protein Ahy_A01g003812 [Arachis hypogaea]